MERIFLARHGQTDWNRAKRIQGQVDTSLNDQGKEQARQLAERLEREQIRFLRVVCSDLLRAYQTAEIVVRHLRHKGLHVVPDRRLRECSFGALEGVTLSEGVERLGMDLFKGSDTPYDFRSAGGEAWDQVLHRHLAAVREHCEVRVRLRTDRDLLFIGHGRGLGTLLAHFQQPYALEQGSYQLLLL